MTESRRWSKGDDGQGRRSGYRLAIDIVVKGVKNRREEGEGRNESI